MWIELSGAGSLVTKQQREISGDIQRQQYEGNGRPVGRLTAGERPGLYHQITIQSLSLCAAQGFRLLIAANCIVVAFRPSACSKASAHAGPGPRNCAVFIGLLNEIRILEATLPCIGNLIRNAHDT